MKVIDALKQLADQAWRWLAWQAIRLAVLAGVLAFLTGVCAIALVFISWDISILGDTYTQEWMRAGGVALTAAWIIAQMRKGGNGG